MINVEKIKPTGLFTNYIFKAIPLAFDESMSYYETLCGLLSYLKDTVIPTLNNNADAIVEVQNLYNELHDYVEHYFDNLDVQEEINNKLDEMAEQGQLTDIIAQYLQLAGVLAYNTVNDMKSADNLTNGSICCTLGYHSINDGGKAYYKIRNILNTDTIDEMFIIALQDNSLIAELIVNNYINPEMLGAYGDETHDDTIPLQACLSSNYPIEFTKNYLINETLNVGGHNEYTLIANNSKINYTGNDCALLIQNINGGEIQLGRIDALNGNCIEFRSSQGTSDRTIYVDLSFKLLRANDKAIYINSSGTGYVSENTIRGGEITRGNYGVYINSNPSAVEYIVNGLHFINMGFEGSNTNYYINAQSQNVRGLTFTNDRFVENVSSTLFELHGNIQRCKMKTWSNLIESRLNISDATLSKFEIECPIYSPGTTTIYADGLYFDSGVKRYIFNSVYSKTLTKNSGVNGDIVMKKMGNMVVVNFNNITVNSTSIDLVTNDKNPFLPEALTNATLIAYATNSVARVWVRANGSIAFACANSSVSETFTGQLIYTTLGEEQSI